MNATLCTVTPLARWRQVNVVFANWAAAEDTAAWHLLPILADAEDEDLIASWFFVRKHPAWRVRYLPAAGRNDDPGGRMTAALCALAGIPAVERVTEVIYEPETRAFGGSEGMSLAHRLFYSDSCHLLLRASGRQMPAAGVADHRRGLALLLTVALLRAAGLDWYEQGDVWARVAAHRQVPEQRPGHLASAVSRYLSADTDKALGNGSRLAVAGWGGAFRAAGHDLAELSAAGRLDRGLRAVLAHHVIFTWNRHGLAHDTQGLLAVTAKDTVFGATRAPTGTGGGPRELVLVSPRQPPPPARAPAAGTSG
jgi:thiopeptide-type bacteriocin biosynthesis protein